MATILDEIFSRGAEVRQWVGIVTSPSFFESIPGSVADPLVAQVRRLDEDAHDQCRGSPEPGQQVASERHARQHCLTAAGLKKFQKAVKSRDIERKRPDTVRPSVRLARIVCYVDARMCQKPAPAGTVADWGVDKKTAKDLGQLNSAGPATKDLTTLASHALLGKKRGDKAQRFQPLDLSDWRASSGGSGGSAAPGAGGTGER